MIFLGLRRMKRVLLLCSMVLTGAVALIATAPAAETPDAGAAEGAAVERRPPVEVRGDIEVRPELKDFSGVRGWRVDGQEISLEEVRDRAVVFHGPYILQDLVSGALLHREAERRGISVTDEEVEAEIRGLREEMGLRSEDALEFHLRGRRLTREGFRQQAREYLLLAKTLADRVYISDREVERFYSLYRDTLYSRRARVEFRVMSFLTEDAATAAKQHLARGRNFVEVARETATNAAERAVAGDLHAYEKGQRPAFRPDFEAVLFAAPLNQVVGPIESLGRYHLVKVEKKTDPYRIPLDEVRGDIRLLLRRQKLERVVWPEWIEKQLATAEIEVMRAGGATAPDRATQPEQENQGQGGTRDAGD
ncbi:MAG: peptidyl-prolyl cis-trans isomerase [Armatimonadota bacterium]|nr:MAG: peptidyl-prolyl cis-trans isomerase [Armatimonadota bacterium]